ncbi:aldo/keto reductase [Candidatus Haliotispira prima]|uniref:Aldo/keto reductase n=1 Tax=Candidatus Haliotispira prima TaxID=3034016 RepID=A0ABY8MF71_9SPIO|nr:aldo/keto reductase [Candidatus Haliotispira prima]
MKYRNLGNSGLQVSVLSMGSWVTFGTQHQLDSAAETIKVAYDAGVNFFDNAEGYENGESERLMGEALRKLGLPRYSYCVSSKYYFGIHPGDVVNMKQTLNRKYLIQAVEASLQRYGFDFIDIIYCHRPDPKTPIEETVHTMHDLITQGKALYWGTSEWSAGDIRAAWDIADRHGLHKPITEQSCYNLITRTRVEQEYQRLYQDIGLGVTGFSPLASGLLSGKYLNTVPENSRAELPGYTWLRNHLLRKDKNDALSQFCQISEEEFSCSAAQLAIAWCAANPRVSSVILGASSTSQMKHNLQSAEVLEKLDTEKWQWLAQLFA